MIFSSKEVEIRNENKAHIEESQREVEISKANDDSYFRKSDVVDFVESYIFEIITESGVDKNLHTNTVLRSIVRGLDNLPTIPQTAEWIPVSERLPERDVDVLTYHKNVCFEYQYISWIDDYSGKWAGFVGNFPDEVLAWMPLPEPYKAKSEDKDE